MEKRGTDRIDDLGVTETPEDVAVLYSWANLHGAKYRDFSASRREYRAQLRHRAAEQVREQALIAQAEAEAAAEAAEAEARKAAAAARHSAVSDSSVKQNLRHAEESARMAAAERVEAARRAEAAATAGASARREEREMADAHASAERQAAQYADSEIRRRMGQPSYTSGVPEVPGEISDPYTPPPFTPAPAAPARPVYTERPAPAPVPQQPATTYAPAPLQAQPAESSTSSSSRRRQGYHPDEASGVRQIYRGPDYESAPDRRVTDSGRMPAPSPMRADNPPPPRERRADPGPRPEASEQRTGSGGQSTSGSGSSGGRQAFPPVAPQPRPEPVSEEIVALPEPPVAMPQQAPAPREAAQLKPFWENTRANDNARPASDTPRVVDRPAAFTGGRTPVEAPAPGSANSGIFTHSQAVRPVAEKPAAPRPVSPFSQAPAQQDQSRGRRAADDSRYNRVEPPRVTVSQQTQFTTGQQPLQPVPGTLESSDSTPPYGPNPTGPAWFYAPTPTQGQGQPQIAAPQVHSSHITPPPPMASVAETLQHSRERVAARWYALKGVFEQPGGDAVEAAPVRQKEIRTPVLAVMSLAGGVGKTSLVATIGRSLSSLGEKVLLTDTTSHGLLPFYFGASELRQGTVRTFSPPSGSTDAPIYLVSYDVGHENGEQERDMLVEEILASSRGTHRVLIDLSVGSAWILRKMARLSPTILVPLAPDMNSVISLQAIEKFFQGMVDADGRPLQPHYVINQFDVSLPLHLDVREVLRRQLGDRLLPFVIHRAPEVSEALAEGMTVVDYAPESPVSGDYLNVATWLRNVAAPATAGFRNVRWSER
jgi:cellulose synthase operon protein YhjQ